MTREGSIVRYTVASLGLDWAFLRPDDGDVASIVEELVATIVAELNKQLAGLAMLWASASAPSVPA